MITIILSRLSYPGCSVTLFGDPHGRSFGVFLPGSKRLLRIHASKEIKKDVKIWRLIQRERKRMKLPPLKEEEMTI